MNIRMEFLPFEGKLNERTFEHSQYSTQPCCRSSVSIIIMIIDYKERYIIVYTASELISHDPQSYHLTCIDYCSECPFTD